MSLARLVFHPRQLDHAPADIPALLQALTGIGLISSQQQDDHHLPGDEFLGLLSFLGCSPHILLHPNEGASYCYLGIDPVSDSPRCLGYTVSVVPRCPVCKQRISDWQTIPDWQQASSQYTCQQCASSTPVSQLNWRQECGYGRFSFHIAQIHPHEAVPSDKLLDSLQQSSGFNWDYFYANN